MKPTLHNAAAAVTLAFLAALFCALPSHAQLLGGEKDQVAFTDSLKKEFTYGPYFGMYKDNYFTLGTTVNGKPTDKNSDVKFQISFAMRLINATLPWHTYLFVMYTQKTWWNVFQESLPMRDNNYNPGIGWTKVFFSKDRYAGKLTLLLEHESNGRDGDSSRSWNKISLCASTLVNDWLMVHAKYFIPIVDGENNKDILRYSGVCQGGFSVTTPNRRWSWGLTVVKRKGWNLNANTVWEMSWKFNKNLNIWAFAQYYNGFGENLIDYNVFHSRARVGICFKPDFFSEY